MIIIVIINDVSTTMHDDHHHHQWCHVELASNDCFSIGIEVGKIGVEVCKTMFLVIMGKLSFKFI